MSEPTITLAQIRRAVSKELMMPFTRRFSAGYAVADSGSTTYAVDAALTQKDKFWNMAWFYRVASQEATLITSFDALTNKLFFEAPITTVATADQYEIHSVWNAYDIHEAINQAIRDVRRIFIDTVTDETLVIEADKLAYTISGLTKNPWFVHRVWLEQPSSIRRGAAAGGGANGITVQQGDADDVTTDWKVSVYDGPAKGQIRSVVSVSGNTITVLPWTTTVPTSASSYALWNPTEEIYDWTPWQAVRFDAPEFPSTLYLSARPTDYLGLRIRIEYSAYASELSAEADTTIIPISYLVPAAISNLHGRMVGDNSKDREMHFAESRRYMERAQSWLATNAPHRPGTLTQFQHGGSYQPDNDNPLGWPS